MICGAIQEPIKSYEKHYDFREEAPIRWKFVYSREDSVDLRMFSSPRHNQLHSGSCPAQAIVKALENKRIQKHGHLAHIDLSRLAVYYLSRELMGPEWILKDEGSYISFAADVLRRWGVGTEEDWPFDLGKIFKTPGWLAMRKAYLGKINAWYVIQDRGQRVEDCILALKLGNPVAFGTVIGDNWDSYGQGSEPLGRVEGTVRGRHATVLLGWNEKKGVFYGENSWGDGWGVVPDMEIGNWFDAPKHTMMGGYYEMRPEVLSDPRSSDFVTIFGGWEPWKKEA